MIRSTASDGNTARMRMASVCLPQASGEVLSRRSAKDPCKTAPNWADAGLFALKKSLEIHSPESPTFSKPRGNFCVT